MSKYEKVLLESHKIYLNSQLHVSREQTAWISVTWMAYLIRPSCFVLGAFGAKALKDKRESQEMLYG